jgi:hypothetical protein
LKITHLMRLVAFKPYLYSFEGNLRESFEVVTVMYENYVSQIRIISKYPRKIEVVSS